MEANIFPTKITVDESKDEKDYPFTIVAVDKTGSVVRLHLDRRINYTLAQLMHQHSACWRADTPQSPEV